MIKTNRPKLLEPMLVFIFSLVSIIFSLFSVPTNADTAKYKDIRLTSHDRAVDLISHMTLDEKIPQLINDAPAIPRLGVREFNWWNEGLHGVAAFGDATVFPQAIGLASTWDDAFIKQVADVVSTEFRAKHYANLHRFGGSDWFGGLSVWAPNINIFRDPRWGRGQETYGEDPLLTARMGVAYVQGLQGNDKHYLKTIATPKHFAVHSGPESGRHRDNVQPSVRDLEETYLPAFKETVIKGNAQSVMCAYNSINGIPACANNYLLNEKLRKEWKFDGFVVSDCEAVFDIYNKASHGFTQTPAQGIKAAFDAGTDLICGDTGEANHIHEALKQGLITEAQIDAALIRLFSARFKLGQFDPREKVFPNITSRDFDTEPNRKMAVQAAQKSLVLLENKNSILPFTSKFNSIAVIGPNANSVEALVGNYNGNPSHPVTILEGVKKRFGDKVVRHEQGVGLIDPLQTPIPDELLCIDSLCNSSGVIAQHFDEREMSLPTKRSDTETNIGVKWQGVVAGGAVRWSGYIKAPESGQYSFRYLANGGYRIWVDDKLILDAWKVDWRPAIVSGYVSLKANKVYSIKVEAFQRGEQGDERLVWSVPSRPQEQEAIDVAKKSDVVLFVGGLTAQLEGEEMPIPARGFVGGDRTDLLLPEVQRQMLKKLFDIGKPVVIVLMNGSALAVDSEASQASGLIEAWYPGGQGGEAVANLLAGDFSPAGRLPITFYKSINDLPAFNDYSMAKRTYRFFNQPVSYPFGYGLSFSKFEYSSVQITETGLSDTPIKIKVNVKNVGKMSAEEVVQAYVSRDGLVGAPIHSLVEFKRINLMPGESSSVEFILRNDALSTVNDRGERKVHPGKAKIWIGGGQPPSANFPRPVAGVSSEIMVR